MGKWNAFSAGGAQQHGTIAGVRYQHKENLMLQMILLLTILSAFYLCAVNRAHTRRRRR